MSNLEHYFTQPATARQRQYEAIRAIVIDKLPVPQAAKLFGYSQNTLYSLLRDVRRGKIELFPASSAPGPKEPQTPESVRNMLIAYRKQNLSCHDIVIRLEEEQGYKISKRTVENIVAKAGFSKLSRRSFEQRGLTLKNRIVPERSSPLDLSTLEPFSVDCPVAGIYFFMPYIIDSGIIEIVKQCQLPASSTINEKQACLSMLLLKLVGNRRLSHMDAYDHEPGLGVFAGLNILPKTSYMSTYSCRTSEDMLTIFQAEILKKFQNIYPELYSAEYINLDFHSIPHFGDQSQMEKVWCGARGKAMKGANTLFAQDADSNVILYTKADILRKNETNEIKKFADYWRSIKGSMDETLVFDCRLTSYKILDDLNQDDKTKIKFITLRKRNKTLLEQVEKIGENEWQKKYLPIPKRKHKHCSVHEMTVTLPGCKTQLRQIIVKDHGRAAPTFIVTNNWELPLKEVLMVYAKRWHIEQKLAELVGFFNLNALSSPLMIRIHFDILWTLIADTLYRRFAQDLPRFEHEQADAIFRKFIDMPGKLIFDGEKFVLKIRKRAMTPILLGVSALKNKIVVPWLGGRTMEIHWTA